MVVADALLDARCPSCGGAIPLDSSDVAAHKNCAATRRGNVLAFGSGYSEDIAAVHRGNVDTAEKKTARLAFDRHYVSWCLQTAADRLDPGTLAVLSLGCGLGFDVMEFVARGHDAYGSETADITEVWREQHGPEARRLVVSGNGAIPFQEGSFDLIVCMNVLEHVGTIPPDERLTRDTDRLRLEFVAQAVSRLKEGGVFLLTAPSRWQPHDRGHSHWYMPGSSRMMARWGGTFTLPISPPNFLPSPADIRRWCRHLPVEVSFRRDRSLFGLRAARPRWAEWKDRYLPLAITLPHFHAVIVRKGR